MQLNKKLRRHLLTTFLLAFAMLATTSYSETVWAARKKTKVHAKKKTSASVKKHGRKVASAKNKNTAANKCGGNVASTTMYYVPHIKDFCSGTKPCAAFKNAVMNPKYGSGTGTLYNGEVLRYTGKTESLSSGCTTAEGARGTCLTPYISVAADLNYYNVGDYIEMPGLKGKKITMPDGRVVEHPGYLIVEDTGGAIKGPNRFDFFTGSLGQFDKKNAFGSSGLKDPVIVDKNVCSDSKKFSKLKTNSSQYLNAQEEVARFMESISGSQRTLASYNAGLKTPGGTK